MRALRGNEGPQRAAQVRHAARTASVNTSSSCLVHERTVDSSQVMRATRHRQPSLRHAGPALTPACRPGPHSGMQAQSSLQHAGTALTQACRPGHHSGMQAWPSLRHAGMALTQACRHGPHSGMQAAHATRASLRHAGDERRCQAPHPPTTAPPPPPPAAVATAAAPRPPV